MCRLFFIKCKILRCVYRRGSIINVRFHLSFVGIADGAPTKKPRTDFTEWEEESVTIILDEVQKYSSTNFRIDGSAEENLLSLWEKQGQSFPRLQHLAKRILCIPATSAASERSFSAAGRVIKELSSES